MKVASRTSKSCHSESELVNGTTELNQDTREQVAKVLCVCV